jgi:hypothetical protein
LPLIERYFVLIMSSDTEFTQYSELEKLSDQELENIVIQGVNLHIHTSKASVAKRILDNRREKKQYTVAENTERVTKQLDKSHKELVLVVSELNQVVGILNFFKSHWLPKQSIWVRLAVFLLGTVIMGIILNLIADWIAKFIFHW